MVTVTVIMLVLLLVVLITALRNRAAKVEMYALCYNLNQCLSKATDEDCNGHAYCMLECEGCPYWHGDERYDK